MRRALVAAVVLAALAAGGCGSGKGKVKGRLVANGQPMSFPPTQVAVVFAPVGADGKPDPLKAFTAVVNEDGTFELIASGGELPAGQYQISIQAMGAMKEKLKGFAAANSRVRRELTSGTNDITIDVTKP